MTDNLELTPAQMAVLRAMIRAWRQNQNGPFTIAEVVEAGGGEVNEHAARDAAAIFCLQGVLIVTRSTRPQLLGFTAMRGHQYIDALRS